MLLFFENGESFMIGSKYNLTKHIPIL